MTMVMLPISPGEAWDRLTILEVKVEKLEGERADTASALLKDVAERIETDLAVTFGNTTLQGYVTALRDINREIWGLEDEVRDFKAKPEARTVAAFRIPKANDERHNIKRKIDAFYGASAGDVKGHPGT